jgi:transposase
LDRKQLGAILGRRRTGRPGDQGGGAAKCKLSAAQLAEMEATLDAGPAASGWDEGQCWTLARITDLVRRRFRVDYTLAGTGLLLYRIGWSVQVPARRAAERDEGWSPAGSRRRGPL